MVGGFSHLSSGHNRDEGDQVDLLGGGGHKPCT